MPLTWLALTSASVAGPERDPIYYFHLGWGTTNWPYGFAVFDDRTYIYYGIDMVWAKMSWLVPTSLIVALLASSLSYAVITLRRRGRAAAFRSAKIS